MQNNEGLGREDNSSPTPQGRVYEWREHVGESTPPEKWVALEDYIIFTKAKKG